MSMMPLYKAVPLGAWLWEHAKMPCADRAVHGRPWFPSRGWCRRALAGALVGFGLGTGLLVDPTPVAAEKYALVIGINLYNDAFRNNYAIPNLQFARDDAEAIGKVLIGPLGYKEGNVHVLTDEDATRETILKKYYKIRRQIRADDEFILYFAGHGLRESVTGEAFWLTHDTNLNLLEIEAIPLTRILRLVQLLPARKKLIILDHCYSGDVRIGTRIASIPLGSEGLDQTGSRSINTARPALAADRSAQIDNSRIGSMVVSRSIANQLFALPPEASTTAIFSASREKAYEDKVLGHGLLTFGLLRALDQEAKQADGFGGGQPDGKLMLREVLAYAKHKAEEARRNLKERLDTPIEQIIDYSINKNSTVEDWQLREWPLILPAELINDLREIVKSARKLGMEGKFRNAALGALRAAQEQLEENQMLDPNDCLTNKIYNILDKTKKTLNGTNITDRGKVLGLEQDIDIAIEECGSV